MVKEIKTEKEFQEIIKKDAVIDFFANWCMPCMALAPVFDKLSKKFKKISFAKVNVDENRGLAKRFSIDTIPTLIFFKKGKIMSVPDFQSIMLPLLHQFRDGKEHSVHEVTDSLAQAFALSEQDVNELLPSGKQPTFYNRVGWARTYLTKSGLLEMSRR